MSISIKIDKKFSKLNKEYIVKAVANFHKEAAAFLPVVIKDTILKGISPVQGVGRFEKYSDSYIAQIEHHRISDKKDNKKNERLLSKGFDAVDKRNSKSANLFRGKLKSPVNMSLRGLMLNSLTSTYTGKETVVYFDSKIAQYHNDLGAGKAKTIRPLLPNKPGQRFTALIDKKLKDLLRNSFN